MADREFNQGFPDAATPSPELRQVMIKMLGALDKWHRAVDGGEDQEMWDARIGEVRKKALNVRDIMTDELVFPGASQSAAYNDAIKFFLDLKNDIEFAKDTLPRPGLLDQAGDFLESLTDFPGEVVEGLGKIISDVGGAAGKGVADTLSALAKNLWPWLLVLGVVVVVVEVGPKKILGAFK